MSEPTVPERDPLWWTALIALAFTALCALRIEIPSKIYFDEIHYVKAARSLLELKRANPEHPLFGKEVLAATIALLGDRPVVWRLPSLLFGGVGLFAFSRALWWASGRRFATIAGALLLATGFAWYIQSRIAMLDMIMAGLGTIALWQFAAAVRQPQRHARARLALTGLCLGLALGAKWSIAPIALLPGLVFLGLKLKHTGRRFLISREGGPVPGITLAEAAWWLGAMPLLVYWATFAPAFFYHDKPIVPWEFIAHHQYMLRLQDSVVKPHPYMSQWYQWIINWRAIWYLYEPVDGFQRGIVLIGNPFTMLAGLPALIWCLAIGMWGKRWDALAVVVLYAAALGMWAVSGKPVQFYYHYLLPGTFLLAALALALDDLWRVRRWWWRWLAPLALVASFGMFAWFFPIISAAELHKGKPAFADWMWLASWR